LLHPRAHDRPPAEPRSIIERSPGGAQRAAPTHLALAIVGGGQSDRQKCGALRQSGRQPKSLAFGACEPRRLVQQRLELVQ
jgi:hypothetical protein